VKYLFAIFALLCCLTAGASETMPPKPDRYFNDYANVTSAATANQLNRALEDFERQTSSQILVAVYPTMQTDSSIEDYTVRVARAWKAGQKGKDNGAILFVFVKEHKMFIQVGYGLEGAMPDIICKRIIDNEITPRFKQGDFNGGLSAGVAAMMAAAKGEYKGTGRTVADARNIGQDAGSFIPKLVGAIFFIVIIFIVLKSIGGGRGGGGGGWGTAAGYMIGSAMSGWGRSGGSSWGGGGGGSWGGGGGGGFSGGGGSFGGGGAGGSW
jgi:uncharacterized protein